jgi:hypothetical protein
MSTESNPFEAVQTIMSDNLGKIEDATKNYLDLMQKAMLSVPNANEAQVNAFKAYLERQVAANQAFVSRLLRAKDFQEAVQIQVEYLQSQMRAAVGDAMQLRESITSSSKRAAG